MDISTQRIIDGTRLLGYMREMKHFGLIEVEYIETDNWEDWMEYVWSLQ